jgi:hypothetical protein
VKANDKRFMKLTEIEHQILFDALTLYKKTHAAPMGRCEISDAIQRLRSKLKKSLSNPVAQNEVSNNGVS